MTFPKINLDICNSYGGKIGHVALASRVRLPVFLIIDGTLFQRYGLVGDYRYIAEPDLYAPAEDEVFPD